MTCSGWRYTTLANGTKSAVGCGDTVTQIPLTPSWSHPPLLISQLSLHAYLYWESTCSKPESNCHSPYPTSQQKTEVQAHAPICKRKCIWPFAVSLQLLRSWSWTHAALPCPGSPALLHLKMPGRGKPHLVHLYIIYGFILVLHFCSIFPYCSIFLLVQCVTSMPLRIQNSFFVFLKSNFQCIGSFLWQSKEYNIINPLTLLERSIPFVLSLFLQDYY